MEREGAVCFHFLGQLERNGMGFGKPEKELSKLLDAASDQLAVVGTQGSAPRGMDA